MKICPACHTGTYGSPAACPGCGVSLLSIGDRGGDDLVGMLIDQKYELTEFIGEGAMGWVYRGLHRSLDSTIAVKLMKPSGTPDESRDQRFAREARAASRLNNPHIISIIDFGSTPGGMLYIISEYLRGRTLSSLLLEERELPLQRALLIMDQVLSAMDEAHSAGLVHRDLKPDNIIITPMRSGEDFVKILDFGIAKLRDPGSQRLTLQGQLFGTPAYMAPEQIRGHEVTARADLYACALILYEMLAGQEPFQSESVMEVLSMQLHNTPPPFSEVAPQREVPAALEELVMRGLAKDPADRFGSAAELRDALHAAVGYRRQTGPIRILGVCSTCGRPLTEGSKFCTECGARQGEPSQDIAFSATLAGDSLSGAQVAVVQRARGTGALKPVERPRARGTPSGAFRVQSQGGPPREPSVVVDTGEPDLPIEPALVGRGAELRALEAFLDGDRRVAQILGSSGSGRTRLLDAAAQLAKARGLQVARAASDPRLVRTPFHPLRALVEEILGFKADQVAPEQVKARALAAGLAAGDLAGIAEILGLGAFGDQVEHAVRRREIRAAAVRLIRESHVGRAGLCLLLDDADEYDGASLTWLMDLVEEGLGARIFMILVGEQEPLPGTPQVVSVALSPLGPADVEQLAAQILGPSRGDSQAAARAVSAASSGLALHVVQGLRNLAEGGTDASLALGALLAQRLGRLPAEALRLLQTVAVLGREAPLPALERLFGASAQVADAVRILERGGFLRRRSETLWEVAHPQVGAAALETMPAVDRRTLHGRALELATQQGALPLVLVRHAREAHGGEALLPLLRAAGGQAEQGLDDAGAALHYRRALEVARWELLLEEASPERLALSLLLGDALRFSGDLSGAALVLKEAVALSGAHPELQARLLRGLGRVHLAQMDEETGLCLMRDAVRAGIFSGSPKLLCELYVDLGRSLLDKSRPEEALAELSEGVAMVTGGDGPDAERAPPTFWRLLLHLGEAQLRMGAAQAALDPAVSALAQARDAPSLVGQARSHLLLGHVFDLTGRDGVASEHYAAALAAFRLLGDRQSAAECLLAKAAYRPEERRALAQLALGLAREVRWLPGQRQAESLIGR